MKKFLFNTLIFVAINLALATSYLWLTQNWYVYNNWDTYSSLLIIPKNQTYDLLILGASHGRVFSSFGNHERLEKILDVRILNISKTAGGLLPEKILMSYFYDRGNTASRILYFIDPPIFYSSTWNEDNYFLEDEPLHIDFLWKCWRVGMSLGVLENYVRSKFSFYWVSSRQPVVELYQDRALSSVDKEAVAKRRAFLYKDGLNPEDFARYAAWLRELVAEARARGAKEIIFIYPPTLLGELPGTQVLTDFIQSLRASYGDGVKFYDFSGTIKEPRFYQDHDHLNTPGVDLFVKRYLKPALATSDR